jgi:hypothetical protein
MVLIVTGHAPVSDSLDSFGGAGRPNPEVYGGSQTFCGLFCVNCDEADHQFLNFSISEGGKAHHHAGSRSHLNHESSNNQKALIS